MARKPAHGRPHRPPGPVDLGTAPVILLLEAAVLSVGYPLFDSLLGLLGGPGAWIRSQYFLASLLVLVLTGGGIWLGRRREKARPQRRTRPKVIPFPEHRRRRGA